MADDNAQHHHHHHHYYREAGQFDQPSPNPHRMLRSRRHRVIAGVCGGLAAYFGWSLGTTRFAALVGASLAPPVVIPGYILLALFMKQESPVRGRGSEDDEFWRSVSTNRPGVTFSKMKHRFRAIDGRVAEMERTVTSEEYRLNRAFRDLDQPAPGVRPSAAPTA